MASTKSTESIITPCFYAKGRYRSKMHIVDMPLFYLCYYRGYFRGSYIHCAYIILKHISLGLLAFKPYHRVFKPQVNIINIGDAVANLSQ